MGHSYTQHERQCCKIFALNSYTLRLSRGWSQCDVARQIGCNNCTISNLEAQAWLPAGRTLIQYAELFDVSVDDLLFSLIDARPFEFVKNNG